MTIWSQYPIKDLTTKVGSGATPLGGETSYKQSGIPLIRSMNVHFNGFRYDGLAFIDERQAAALDGVTVKAHDVLLNITGASIGRVTIAPPELAGARVNQHVCIIRPIEVLSPKFLAHFLASPNQQAKIMQEQVGATRQGLTKARILDFDIPVPPANEQRRIVAKIEELFSDLDAGVAALERVRANLKRYRASVLKAAVEGRLTEKWRKENPSVEPATKLLQRILTERRKKWEEQQLAKFAEAGKSPAKNWQDKYEESTTPDTTNLPELPKGWCWVRIDSLAKAGCNSIGAGPFGTIFKAHDFRPSGVPIIFLRHVAPGCYLKHKPTYMDVAKWKELFRDYSVFGGELLVTKLGEPPGTCAIYPIGLGPAMVTPDVIRMTLDERIALPQYVMYYLNSSLGRRFTSGAAYGTTRQRVTLPLFRELPVPLPPPAEQRYIITELERLLSSLEASDCMMVAGLQRSSRLRQSILKRAFEGKLVPQDPKDEPAELLLNRIRGKEEQDSGSNVGARRRRNKTSVKRSIEK